MEGGGSPWGPLMLGGHQEQTEHMWLPLGRDIAEIMHLGKVLESMLQLSHAGMPKRGASVGIFALHLGRPSVQLGATFQNPTGHLKLRIV